MTSSCARHDHSASVSAACSVSASSTPDIAPLSVHGASFTQTTVASHELQQGLAESYGCHTGHARDVRDHREPGAEVPTTKTAQTSPSQPSAKTPQTGPLQLWLIAIIGGAIATILATQLWPTVAHRLHDLFGQNGRAPITSTSTTPAPTAAPNGHVIALPGNSPLKESGIPNMDTICGHLGYNADAWVPGQSAPHDLAGRILYSAGQAYHWSCGEGGAWLSPDQITAGCQIWKPGSVAYTWDPNYAYSWVCI